MKALCYCGFGYWRFGHLPLLLLSKHLPQEAVARVLGIMGIISVGFVLFVLFTSNPFTRTFP